MMIKPIKVLIIEDLPVYDLLLKQILRQNQIESESADNLEDGIELAEEKVFDAVLLDLGLPDSQGLETFTIFQSRIPTLPVIILSGLDDESLAASAVQNGAQDYLIKGNYLTQGDAGSKLLQRSIQYAVERHRIQLSLLHERSQLEVRVAQRTTELLQANQRLQILAAHLVSAQEDERRRLSLELHDEVGQALTALGLSLSMLRTELSDDQSGLDKYLKEAIKLSEKTLERMRELAHNLRPPAVDNVGLRQSLWDLCQRMGQLATFEVSFHSNEVDSLPGSIQISVYRVVQEALTNIVKYAWASHVRIQLESDAEGLHLLIQDDGVGFSAEQRTNHGPNNGIGLSGMRERIEALGGNFEINSESGIGTTIQVWIPPYQEVR